VNRNILSLCRMVLLLMTFSNPITSPKQEGLAVARIARDDGSSSRNCSSDGYDYLPAVTQLCGTHFSITQFILSLRTTYDVVPF